jgi:hypothetical protein
MSLAVAPAVARCTNRCTCRKASLIAVPTNRKLTEKYGKMKKICQHKKSQLIKLSPRARMKTAYVPVCTPSNMDRAKEIALQKSRSGVPYKI